MRKFLMSLLTALLFLQIPAQAQAQDTQDNEKLVQIRLLAERAKVSGGDEIWIGIKQSSYIGTIDILKSLDCKVSDNIVTRFINIGYVKH